MEVTVLKLLGYPEQGRKLTVPEQSNLGSTAREKTRDGRRTQVHRTEPLEWGEHPEEEEHPFTHPNCEQPQPAD